MALIVAIRYGDFSRFCPVHYLIIVFSGSCHALSSPCWLGKTEPFFFFFFFFFLFLFCFCFGLWLMYVCHGLFPLPVGVIGHVLLLCPVLYICTILFVLICDSSCSHFEIHIILCSLF